jgi:hypothetical protein
VSRLLQGTTLTMLSPTDGHLQWTTNKPEVNIPSMGVEDKTDQGCTGEVVQGKTSSEKGESQWRAADVSTFSIHPSLVHSIWNEQLVLRRMFREWHLKSERSQLFAREEYWKARLDSMVSASPLIPSPALVALTP